jgi:Icc protein
MRILQVTDTHLAADPRTRLKDFDTDQSFRAVLEAVRRTEPSADLMVLTGDLVHDGSAEGYRRLDRYLRDLGLPCFCIPGNHDDPATMRSVLAGGFARFEEAIIARNWHLVFLDSHVPGGEHGTLGPQRLQGLGEQLHGSSAGHVLLFVHHQPVPVGSPWIDSIGLTDATELWRVVARFPRVRGAVFGHVHQAFEDQRGSVRLMGTPSTCMQFRPRRERMEIDRLGPGFRSLDLHPDGLIQSRVVHPDPAGEVLP